MFRSRYLPLLPPLQELTLTLCRSIASSSAEAHIAFLRDTLFPMDRYALPANPSSHAQSSALCFLGRCSFRVKLYYLFVGFCGVWC